MKNKNQKKYYIAIVGVIILALCLLRINSLNNVDNGELNDYEKYKPSSDFSDNYEETELGDNSTLSESIIQSEEVMENMLIVISIFMILGIACVTLAIVCFVFSNFFPRNSRTKFDYGEFSK